MTTFNPFASVNLHGDALMRGVTLALPTATVRNLIPAGLDLLPQDVTPAGTHPVILLYHDLFRAQMSIPTLLPSLTYREHSVGIPFTCVVGGATALPAPGPYYYMPILFLDNLWATLGGRLYWGYPKDLAAIELEAQRFSVRSLDGRPLTSLLWNDGVNDDRPFQPARQAQFFQPSLAMTSQPLITQVPFGAGPFFVLSDFDKDWDFASVRPLHTAVEITSAYVTGLDCGRYPREGWSDGIDTSIMGSYELRARWRISLPYPALPGASR